MNSDISLSTEKTPWGASVVPKIDEDALRNAGLFYTVASVPLRTTACGEVPDRRALLALPEAQSCASQVGARYLGTVGTRYQILSNRVLVNAVRDGLDAGGTGHVVTDAGTTKGLRRFYMSVAIEGHEFLPSPDGHEIKQYLTVTTTHDGTGSVVCSLSTKRLVCLNVLARVLARRAGSAALTHRSGLHIASELEEIVKRMTSQGAAMALQLKQLHDTPCDVHTSTRRALRAAWAVPASQELGPRREAQVAECVHAAHYGAGNQGRSLYDVLNGVTDVYSRRGLAAEYGSATVIKSRVFDQLVTNCDGPK